MYKLQKKLDFLAKALKLSIRKPQISCLSNIVSFALKLLLCYLKKMFQATQAISALCLGKALQNFPQDTEVNREC